MTNDEDEPTRRFADGDESSDNTGEHYRPETEPTLLRETDKIANEPAILGESYENDFAPSRVRFILICLLFAFTAVWLVVNNYNLFSIVADIDLVAEWRSGVHRVVWVAPQLSDKIEVGDQVLSIDGQPLDAKYSYRKYVRRFGADETHLFRFEREGAPFDAEIRSKPIESGYFLHIITNGIIIPAAFLIVGLFVFLFKPDTWLTVLCAIAFALIAASTSPLCFISYAEASFLNVFLWQLGYISSLISGVVLLHFILYFPKPSWLLRRFPKLPVLIYLPFLIYVLPTEIGLQFAWNGFTQFDFIYEWSLLYFADLLYTPYLLADLVVLFLNYRQSDEAGRRRMRILLFGIPLAILPFMFVDSVLPSIEWLTGKTMFSSTSMKELVANLPIIIAPPVFAYAVVKNRVIPISIIVRRGIQYLFAKNGLRLLVLLPLAGIVLNLVDNPDRTLGEIVFRNSGWFYFFAISTIGFALLSRFRLNEWIDRKFFREQFDQERLLRGLIENVKESDSMIKLSRLVSSQIQAAIHPKSIHFFYEDQTNSEFSLGFTTAENSGKMRLAADSPLLHFMRSRNSTVEFPSAETEELPTAELEWLRQIETNLIVPMHGTDDNLVGFFSLGEKLSEIPYTNRDKELLETLADQIALVHENINLKDRMRSDLRIRNEVLSRFEAGDVNLLKECPRCGRCYDRTDTKCDDDGAELTFSLPVERTIEKRYRLQRLIGKGGMGAVYEATDERIGRSVAVKILSSSLFGNREAQRRFEREARTSGQLSHRNIVAIYDYGVLSTEGAFLVMELVRGETLSNVLRSERTLETNTVVDWFEQVLNGLEIAHNSGIIHRDLKPDNILVARDDNADRLRILDFGLARFNKSDVEGSVTMPGTVMGTLGYMSPEQLQGQRAAERSDLFSVGVIIFECLYGKRPFPGRTYLEIVQSMNQPRNFDLAEPFGSFFQTALADDPVLRFSNAATMKETLRGLREQ